MTIRWIEGFETERTYLKLSRKYQDVERLISSSWLPGTYAGPGRYHGYSVRELKLRTKPLVSSPTNTWVMGVSIKLDNSGFLTGSAIHVLRGDQKQVSIFPVASGSNFVLEVRRGSTVIQTGTVEMYYNTWYYIEISVTVATGTSGSIQIRTDETTYMTITEENTANSGSSGADVIQLDSGMWLDDIYIKDTSGYLGIQVVEGVFPNEDKSTEWSNTGSSGHFADVDDAADSDETGPDHNVYTSTSGDVDVFGFSTLSQLSGEINAVQLNAAAALDRLGILDIRFKYQDENDQSSDMDWVDVTGSKKIINHIQENNPITGISWTVKDISDGFFGIERS